MGHGICRGPRPTNPQQKSPALACMEYKTLGKTIHIRSLQSCKAISCGCPDVAQSRPAVAQSRPAKKRFPDPSPTSNVCDPEKSLALKKSSLNRSYKAAGPLCDYALTSAELATLPIVPLAMHRSLVYPPVCRFGILLLPGDYSCYLNLPL